MTELIVLGTAASVPDEEHDTVGLVLRGPDWAILIECGGSPLHKLARLGVDLEEIRAVVLSHRHADHLYGFPMLVQGMWIGGRESPLPVYGPAETLDVAQTLLELFALVDRADMFAVEWNPVPLREGRPVLETNGVRITATPGTHAGVGVLALRIEDTVSGRAIVYSADTEPCPAVTRLAEGADLLLHEASGGKFGHSSPAQAAEVAQEAGVARLVLTHYPVRGVDLRAWLSEAAEFPGPTALARDGDVYPL